MHNSNNDSSISSLFMKVPLTIGLLALVAIPLLPLMPILVPAALFVTVAPFFIKETDETRQAAKQPRLKISGEQNQSLTAVAL